MKLTCIDCYHEFNGNIWKDDFGRWLSKCPECKNYFVEKVPEGRIVMAFTDPDENEVNPYQYFTEKFHGQNIHLYMAFNTPEEFVAKWKEIYDKPNGMWYWCLDDGYCFCSGACDPGDIEIFEDYFGMDFGSEDM